MSGNDQYGRRLFSWGKPLRFLASVLYSEMRYINLVPRAFLVVARELRKTLVKYDEISKILGDLSHAQ
jgi:hypothetical protein